MTRAGPSVQTIKLLVVEDEPLLAHSLGESLSASGFQPTLAASSEAAWAALWAGAFDLIVLDVMLPEGDEAGFRLARALREADFTQPILFLSARETLPDRVRGLEHGDDYLPKPFALPELVARLRALYRRKEVRPQSVHFGTLELRPGTRQVTLGGVLVRLTAREYEVLELLLLNPGRIFTRDEILGRIWGAGFDTPSNLVDVYVKNLRLKAGAATVETVRGLGYRFPGA